MKPSVDPHGKLYVIYKLSSRVITFSFLYVWLKTAAVLKGFNKSTNSQTKADLQPPKQFAVLGIKVTWSTH